MHWIQKRFCPTDFFWSVMKMKFTKKICLTCTRVCQIQALGQSGYKTEIFSKRTHKISKKKENFFRFLWILGKLDWRAKLESAFSLMVCYCKITSRCNDFDLRLCFIKKALRMTCICAMTLFIAAAIKKFEDMISILCDVIHNVSM